MQIRVFIYGRGGSSSHFSDKKTGAIKCNWGLEDN